MKLGTWIALGAGALALVVLACEAGSGEGEPGATSCGAHQRFYNGACALTCVTQTDCNGQGTCAMIEDNAGVCITAADGGTELGCSYLESDTKCLEITDYAYDPATGGFTRPWYWGAYGAGANDGDPGRGLNDNKDSSFVLEPGYWEKTLGPYGLSPYWRPWIGNGQCRGDGKFVVVPATGTPACGQKHAVTRCQTTGDAWGACRLVDGTTTDRPTP